MRKPKNKMSVIEALWIGVLSGAASNVVCTGTARWTFFIVMPLFFYAVLKIRERREAEITARRWKISRHSLLFISAVFGILAVIGANYSNFDNLVVLLKPKEVLFSTCIRMFGTAVLSYYAAQAVVLLYLAFPPEKETGRGRSGKRSFFFWWLVFLLVWLPYLVINYPGHLMGDTCSQILMAFNLPNKFSSSVTLISEDVLLTNHHPILHTMLLGGTIRLGQLLFNSDTVGLFLYTLVQYLAVTCVYGYALSWLERKGAPKAALLVLALIWLLVPNFPEYAILATKDSLFSAFLLLYGIRTAALLTAKTGTIRRKDLLILLLCAVCCMLTRNNGFYIIFLSMPFLAVALKSVRRQLIIMTVFVLLMHVGYNQVLLPALKITPGSVRETLSAPLQQVARYFVMYPDEVTEEEAAAFDKVVRLDRALAEYSPVKADSVKSKFRSKHSTPEDLRGFFKLWLSVLRRHPLCCIQATLCSTNGYYSFQEKSVLKYDHNSANYQARRLKKLGGPEIKYPPQLSAAATWVRAQIVGLAANPVIYLFTQAAFYNWILVFILWLALTAKSSKILALFMMPAIALLTAIAGPMNASTYFRYEFPIAVTMPFLATVLLCCGEMLRTPDRKAAKPVRTASKNGQ